MNHVQRPIFEFFDTILRVCSNACNTAGALQTRKLSLTVTEVV